MSSGKLKVIEGKKRRDDEETEEIEEQEPEQALSEGKGRATPGRRQQVEEEVQGNFITRPLRNFVSYLGEVRGELEKVTWPTREETVRLTRIVLVSMVAASIILGLMSLLFTELFRLGLDTPALLVGLIVIAFAVAIFWLRRSNQSTGGY